jgi:hypothetical protein
MRLCISRAWIAERHRAVTPFLPRPATWCCLAVGLLVVSAGCKGGKRSVPYTEVTGKVIFNGKGLTGGRVTFVAVNGGFASNGDIDENGNYSINAPVGEVQITVDNTMLRQRIEAPHPKRPGSEEARPLKGKYVDIPLRYRDASQSGLKYTVKPGPAAQTHDIELNNNPDPATNMPPPG